MVDQGIPVFKLYGEFAQWSTNDAVHCESISARSKLHNWRIRPHRHSGLYQLLYLRSGWAQLQIDDQCFVLQAGQILFIPKMCVHEFLFETNSRGRVITFTHSVFDHSGEHVGSALTGLAKPIIYTLGNGPSDKQIELACDLIHAEYQGAARSRNLLITSLLATILIYLMRNSVPVKALGEREKDAGDKHFLHFVDLIEQHYVQQHLVGFYADQIGVTAAHLTVVTRQVVNKSPLELIHERLLFEAKRRLLYTAASVHVVAYELGFSDPAYFAELTP